MRWFCHLGPFPRAPLDPQETGEFPKGNVSCRTPGINRTPAKVRRRAASRNLDWPKGTLHASYAHVAYIGYGTLLERIGQREI